MTTPPVEGDGAALDLTAVAALVERPDDMSRTDARELAVGLTLPAGGLGPLVDLGVWLAGAQGRCPPQLLQRVRLVVFAGDHGMSGVSAHPDGATVALANAVMDGTSPGGTVARLSGVGVRVVDVSVDADPMPGDVSRDRVRRRSGAINVTDACTLNEVMQAFALGRRVADEEVDAGADFMLLGNVGVGSTTAAAALVGLLTRSNAAQVTGRGSGIDDGTWMRKCAAVRDAMRRGRPVLGEQLRLLAVAGGPDLAAMSGFLIQAAIRRTPVLLDGVVSAAAALVSHRIAFRAADWWLAAHASTEPAYELAIDRLSLDPVLDVTVDVGDGTGALLVVPVLAAAAAVLAEAQPAPELPLE